MRGILAIHLWPGEILNLICKYEIMNENIAIKPQHTDPLVLPSSSKTSCFNFPKDQHAFFTPVTD